MTEPEDQLAALKLLINDAVLSDSTTPREAKDTHQHAVDYAIDQGLILDHGDGYHISRKMMKVVAICAISDPTFAVVLCGWAAGVSDY